MSVAAQLGLNDEDGDLLASARSGWPDWQQTNPCLLVCPDLLALPAWIRGTDPARADEVLLCLARLSATDGGNDPTATAALCWLLLPGACRLAATLTGVTSRVDEAVAAQLWIQARTYRWRTGHRVAANILANTRKAILRDLGLAGPEHSWSRTVSADQIELLAAGGALDPAGDEAAVYRAHGVLDQAEAVGVLQQGDRAFVLDLAAAASGNDSVRDRRGYAGLLGEGACATVAARWGVSRSTVVRRAKRTVGALRDQHSEVRLSA